MKLASHNTFTFLTPRTWWMRLLAFTARCQRVNFAAQLDCGAQMFDIRVRFKGSGVPIICHGLIEYQEYLPVTDSLLYLNYCCKRQGIPYYCRIVLETKHPDDFQIQSFRTLCKAYQDTFQDIVFFGGNDRSDWSCQHPVYDFGTPMPDIDEEHASTTALFPRFPRLDDLWPWLYTRLFNHRNIQAGTTHEWLMIDFVDIQ